MKICRIKRGRPRQEVGPMLRWYRERARLRRETRKCAEWLMSDMYEEIVLTWKRLGLYKQHGPRERQRQKASRMAHGGEA